MIVKYTKKFKEEDLISVLSTAYMKQCLSIGNIEYMRGSANTIGFIVGALGLEPEIIIKEAKAEKKKRMGSDNEQT